MDSLSRITRGEDSLRYLPMAHDVWRKARKQWYACKMMQYWWLILLSIICGVAGQTVIKIGVSQPGAEASAAGFVSLVMMILRSPLVLLGLVLYGLGALAWIALLARVDLSIAYPFLALNFVLVTLSSQFLLGESVPRLRWMGVLVICAGILLVARTST